MTAMHVVKRTAYLALSLAALGAVAWLSLDIAESIHARKKAKAQIHPLPNLKIERLNGERVSLDGAASRGTVLLFFSTTCPYCRDEIAELVEKKTLFDQTRVVLLSGEPYEILRRFNQELGIERWTHFIVGIDDDHAITRRFGIRRIPATFVYTADGMLVERYDGVVRAATIAAALPAPIGAAKQARHSNLVDRYDLRGPRPSHPDE